LSHFFGWGLRFRPVLTLRFLPARVGTSFNGVGEPLKAPAKIFFSRSSVICFPLFRESSMPDSKKPSPTKLTRKHYEGMGRIIFNWAKVENRLIYGLQHVTGMGLNEAIIMFWHTDFSHRKDRFFTALYSFEPAADLKKAADTFSRRMESAYEIRNLIAHSLWNKAPGKFAIQPFDVRAKNGVVKFTNGGGLPDQIFTPSRLATEAETIGRLQADLGEFLSERVAPFARSVLRTKAAKKKAK
jgi:hypothetical protein